LRMQFICTITCQHWTLEFHLRTCLPKCDGNSISFTMFMFGVVQYMCWIRLFWMARSSHIGHLVLAVPRTWVTR
jgi:hypothetical protein